MPTISQQQQMRMISEMEAYADAIKDLAVRLRTATPEVVSPLASRKGQTQARNARTKAAMIRRLKISA